MSALKRYFLYNILFFFLLVSSSFITLVKSRWRGWDYLNGGWICNLLIWSLGRWAAQWAVGGSALFSLFFFFLWSLRLNFAAFSIDLHSVANLFFATTLTSSSANTKLDKGNRFKFVEVAKNLWSFSSQWNIFLVKTWLEFLSGGSSLDINLGVIWGQCML